MQHTLIIPKSPIEAFLTVLHTGQEKRFEVSTMEGNLTKNSYENMHKL